MSNVVFVCFIQDFDECQSQPCLHGGDCTNSLMTYMCDCADGFAGDNCETDVDECVSNPYCGSGNCTDMVNSYRCECDDGYGGPLCETLPSDAGLFWATGYIHDGVRYALSQNWTDWFNASDVCRAENATLAVIVTESAEQFLSSLVDSSKT